MSRAKPDTEAEDDSPRLDKWLWAARFFKTRALAIDAINAGHVRLIKNTDQQRVKPAYHLKVGELVFIQKEAQIWQVRVTALESKRGNAQAASLLYEETADSLAAREAAMLTRQAAQAHFTPPVGRPSKRDRRLIDAYRESH